MQSAAVVCSQGTSPQSFLYTAPLTIADENKLTSVGWDTCCKNLSLQGQSRL